MADMVFHKKNRMNSQQLVRIAKLLDRDVMEAAQALTGGATGDPKEGGRLLGELQEATNLRALWTAIQQDAAEPEPATEETATEAPAPVARRRRSTSEASSAPGDLSSEQ